MKKLTPKQKRFVEEYLVDLNATKAAIRAGYSEKNAGKIGPELLGKTRIAEAINKAMKEQQERTQITADKVLHQLYRQAFADIRDFVTWEDVAIKVGEEDDGTPIIERTRVIRLKDMKEVDGTLITEIRETKDGIVFKRTDPQKALELLGKHLKLFTDKQEVSGPNGGEIVVKFVDPGW